MDAAGMTQEEVAALPLERQFDLFGERYVHMQELLADAQRAISTGPWTWGGKGIGPSGGSLNVWAMPGATTENSYYLVTSRSIRLPGATGEQADTEPMVAYFEAQGWSVAVEETQTGSYRVEAMTDQGYWFVYMVQPNGWYTLTLYSKVFWGDVYALTFAVIDRIPNKDSVDEVTPPGEYIPFPKWSDPIVVSDEDE